MSTNEVNSEEKCLLAGGNILDIKNNYQDCLLICLEWEIFYETFDEDAKKLSSILNIALSASRCWSR